MRQQRVAPTNRAQFMTVLILGVGLVVTGAIFGFARRDVANDFVHDFKDEGASQVANLTTYLNARLLFLDDLARHLALSGRPEPQDFQAFVAKERQRVEGIQALEWAPMVRHADRWQVEAEIRHDHDGFTGLLERDPLGALRPAQARSWYVPVAFIEPLQGNRMALGYDLASDPERRAAIEAARDSGKAKGTGPIMLVQEQQLQAGFLIFVPVYAKGRPQDTVEQRREALQGMVLAAFKTSDLLGAALGGSQRWSLSGELRDLDAPGAHGALHHWGDPQAGLNLTTRMLLGDAPIYRDRLVVAGRTWEAALRPTPAFIANHLQRWVWLIPPAGLVLTAFLATLFQLVLLQKVRAERLVGDRTQALGESLARLASREDDLRLLLDSIAEAVYGLDLHGRCTFCNRALLRILGYPGPEAVVGRNMHHLTHHTRADGTPLDEQDCRIFAAFREGQGTHGEDEVFWRADGTSFPVEYRSFPQYRDGAVVGAVVTFSDITARLQAERDQAKLQAQLLQSQKLESLGSLAGGVAHDMNNVLAAILGLASANLKLQPAGSATFRAFETITKAATRGGKMVKGLLSFARQGPAEALEIDLNALLAEGGQLLAQTTLSKVRVHLDLAPELGLIRGDAGALTHAFMNLFVNAVDAMGGTGLLTLRTRKVDAAWLEVQVEDTGPGMSREVADRAFDPFFTTKAPGQGTGLGLSIVYNTVKAHQGLIELQSAPGAGTRVVLRFPAAPAAAKGIAIRPERLAQTPEVGALSVLLVDDDEFIQESLGSILEQLGHPHRVVSSGEEALVELQTGWVPDVVILDMNMPGLGGAATLPRLRALCPDLPVLLSTGRVDQEALDLTQAFAGVTLLAKPFPLADLQRALQATVRMRKGKGAKA